METISIVALILSACWLAFSIYVMLAVLRIQRTCEATLIFLKQAPGLTAVVMTQPIPTVAARSAPATAFTSPW